MDDKTLKTYKIGIIGSNGKMGLAIQEYLKSYANFSDYVDVGSDVIDCNCYKQCDKHCAKDYCINKNCNCSFDGNKNNITHSFCAFHADSSKDASSAAHPCVCADSSSAAHTNSSKDASSAAYPCVCADSSSAAHANSSKDASSAAHPCVCADSSSAAHTNSSKDASSAAYPCVCADSPAVDQAHTPTAHTPCSFANASTACTCSCSIFINPASNKFTTESISKSKLVPICVTRDMNFREYVNQADVWLDFSLNELAIEHIKICEKHNKPILIGTTGSISCLNWHPKCPVMFAPNCSLTWNLVRSILKYLNDHEAIITDTHHQTKRDAPSGTTKDIVAILPRIKGIHSFRNNISGAKMQLDLSDSDEMLHITYETLGRLSYAKGAILASLWLIKQCKGEYLMGNSIWEIVKNNKLGKTQKKAGENSKKSVENSF